MAVLYPTLQFFDANGNPLSLGKVYTYITNTSTPKATYTDASQGSQHTNPVILDDEGRTAIWLATDQEYRIIVKDSNDSAVGDTLDNITGVGIQLAFETELLSNLDVNNFAFTNSNTDGNITLTPNGAGTVLVTGNASQSGRISLAEDTDNGTHTVTIAAPASVSSSRTQTLQDVTGTVYVTGGTDIAVTDGGTGSSTAAGAATNLGLGTGDSPQFTAVNIGDASDTTLSRVSAGNLQIENNIIYRAGGTDVPVIDGGTGSSTAAGAATNLGLGTGDSPQFTAVNIGHASDTTITRTGAGSIAVEGNEIYRAGMTTDIPVSEGGTGAGTASGARTNLGAAASGANTDLTSIYLNNTGLKIKDTNASHGLSIVPGSDITADKTLTITTGDVDKTLSVFPTYTLATSSSNTSVEVTGLPTSTVLYDQSCLRAHIYISASGGTTITAANVQFDTDNGASYVAAGYLGQYTHSTGATVNSGATAGDTGIDIAAMGNGIESGREGYFVLEINDEGSNTQFWTLQGLITDSGSVYHNITASGTLGTLPIYAINAMKITFTGGTTVATRIRIVKY